MNGVHQHGHINAGLDGNHLGGLGVAPTIVLGPGSGAGSFTISGNDNAFSISITTGAGTANNSIVFTATFNTAFTLAPRVVFAPGNANAAASNTRVFISNKTTTSFEFRITNPALSSGQVYIWDFIIL